MARWTFPKAYKIFQGYLKLYSNYMNIIQIQIANELNPKSQKQFLKNVQYFGWDQNPYQKLSNI